MRKIHQLLALAFLVTISSCEDEKSEDTGMEMGNLYVSNSKPQPGDQLSIKYSKTGAETPEATVNYLVGNQFYPTDIDLKDSAEAYYGKITIPDTVHAIAFNFKNDDKYDTNEDKGYVLTLYGEDGKELPKSKATKGIYLANAAGIYDLKVEKDSAFVYMDEAIKNNPELKEEFDSDYSNAMLSVDREKADAYIDERIAYYHQKDSLSKDNLNTLASLYRARKEEAKADSISKVTIERFPKSQVAKRDLMMKVVQSPELEKKVEFFNTYEEKIGTEGYEKDIMLRFIANAYAADEDWENFRKYASQMDDPMSKARVYNSVAWGLAEKGENLDFAGEISEKSLDLLDPESAMEHKPDMYSKKQFKNSLDYSRAMYADTYALIKYKQGDLDKAIEIQEDAISDKSSADANTRYVKFLTEAKQYDKAIKHAEEFITDNRASAEIEEHLKTAYSNTEQEQDFETYMASLKEEALTKQRNELEEDMLNEEAPAFKLQDLDGNEIALADLKGKTVILDFWATWCGPCKMSFPGMQKAVEEYEDNENVAIFFVNTWENGSNREQTVSDFIKDNNYSFHVLMDTPVEEGSREFEVVSEYGITGIPTKIIIGPEGKINFRKVGYSGNNTKMLQEIDLMIELTQKDKSPEA